MLQQIWYQEPFYDEKDTLYCTIDNQIFSLKCGFGIGYGIGRKYWPICVSVSASERNQNSGFGCTLGWIQATMQQNTIPSGVKFNVHP